MKKIVFTNGCFDILHRGHVEYLEQAKSIGDFLIVGLNSDKSMYGLKGENRPINNEEDRKIVLMALECVDEVIIFEEKDPLRLVKEIKPDIIVKGGDWKEEDIIGAKFVIDNGGQAYSIPFRSNCSTSKIIEKIRNLNE